MDRTNFALEASRTTALWEVERLDRCIRAIKAALPRDCSDELVRSSFQRLDVEAAASSLKQLKTDLQEAPDVDVIRTLKNDALKQQWKNLHARIFLRLSSRVFHSGMDDGLFDLWRTVSSKACEHGAVVYCPTLYTTFEATSANDWMELDEYEQFELNGYGPTYIVRVTNPLLDVYGLGIVEKCKVVVDTKKRAVHAARS